MSGRSGDRHRLGREAVGRFPWVRVLTREVWCDAISEGSGMACSRTARWSFTPLPSAPDRRSRRYCLVHLLRFGLYRDEYEARRTNRWIDQHPEEFPTVHPPAPLGDIKLDLSLDEDLAVLISLVPNWAELAEGLNLREEQDAKEYISRLQQGIDEAVERLGLTARALRSMPTDGTA